jgi:phosphatidylglycerol:prolipoprotein diacylglycerol transferase
MPFLTIAFPVFDPIAISIGPIAIRWYALAYIGGIVLGWIYARSLVRTKIMSGRPRSAEALDGFILGHRYHRRRPAPVTCCSIIGLLHTAPGRDFRVWKGGMSFHGGFTSAVSPR